MMHDVLLHSGVRRQLAWCCRANTWEIWAHKRVTISGIDHASVQRKNSSTPRCTIQATTVSDMKQSGGLWALFASKEQVMHKSRRKHDALPKVVRYHTISTSYLKK